MGTVHRSDVANRESLSAGLQDVVKHDRQLLGAFGACHVPVDSGRAGKQVEAASEV